MSRTLSIVIPTLNEGAVIERLLEALQPLRVRDCELIVADGGSTDTTRDLALPLVDQVVACTPGRAQQMNRGAQVASGDWLWFVHADSGFAGDAGIFLQAILGSPREWGRFDVRLEADAWVYCLIETLMNWRSRLSGIATGDQGMFVRRRLFEAEGGFAAIPLMEDIELSRRLRKHGRPACVPIRLCTSARRWQQHGVLRTVFLMWRLRLAYYLGAEPARLAEAYRLCSSPRREY